MPPKRACKAGTTGERCVAHNAVATLYCSTCRRVACLQCLEQDLHSHHVIVSLKKADDELNEELQSALNKAEQILRDGSMRCTSPALNPFAGRLESLVERVQSAAQQLHRAVDAFAASLVARVLQCACTAEMERADERLAQTCFEESLRTLVHKLCAALGATVICKAHLGEQANEVFASAPAVTTQSGNGDVGPSPKRPRPEQLPAQQAIAPARPKCSLVVSDEAHLAALSDALETVKRLLRETEIGLFGRAEEPGKKENDAVAPKKLIKKNSELFDFQKGTITCIHFQRLNNDAYKVVAGNTEKQCLEFQLKAGVKLKGADLLPSFYTQYTPVAILPLQDEQETILLAECISTEQQGPVHFSIYRALPFMKLYSFIPAESNGVLPLDWNGQMDLLVARDDTHCVFAGKSRDTTAAHVLALLELSPATPIKLLRTVSVESCVHSLAYNTKLHKLCVSLVHAIAVFDDEFAILQLITCPG